MFRTDIFTTSLPGSNLNASPPLLAQNSLPLQNQKTPNLYSLAWKRRAYKPSFSETKGMMRTVLVISTYMLTFAFSCNSLGNTTTHTDTTSGTIPTFGDDQCGSFTAKPSKSEKADNARIAPSSYSNPDVCRSEVENTSKSVRAE